MLMPLTAFASWRRPCLSWVNLRRFASRQLFPVYPQTVDVCANAGFCWYPDLVERHADPLLLAPNDVAGNVRAIRPKDKVEALGDVERTSNIECRTRNGNVSD
jgi:hypothetical protein